jgi:CDP-2,3-bis-(O-geranylgeranyl)-sn-glycerol synthase
MDYLFDLLIGAVWFILPAYIANSAPVDVSQIGFLRKYAMPIDGGMTWKGIRILGDSKTWRGFYAGMLAGTLTAAIQGYVQPALLAAYPDLPVMTVDLGFMLSLGALFGDMAASFIKRRIGMKAGQSAPLMDQLDFIFGAVVFAYLWECALSGTFSSVFDRMIGLPRFGIILLVTPFLHIIGNLIAWIWKLKKQPW